MRTGSIILFWMLISPVFWGQNTPSDPPPKPQDVAPGEVVEYDAQDIYFSVDSGLAYLTGEATVVSGTMTLTAHRIVLDLNRSEVCAFGKRDSVGGWIGRPAFQDGSQSFSQDELCYNFETGKGLSRQAVTTEQDIVFHAGRAKRQPDETVHVRNGKFTTCDADNPHFHFHLTKAIMVPNEKVVSGPLYLKFRKIPTPLALPFGWFPLQREKQREPLVDALGRPEDVVAEEVVDRQRQHWRRPLSPGLTAQAAQGCSRSQHARPRHPQDWAAGGDGASGFQGPL